MPKAELGEDAGKCDYGLQIFFFFFFSGSPFTLSVISTGIPGFPGVLSYWGTKKEGVL